VILGRQERLDILDSDTLVTACIGQRSWLEAEID
jgi:hypothetical protein